MRQCCLGPLRVDLRDGFVSVGHLWADPARLRTKRNGDFNRVSAHLGVGHH